MRSASLRGSSSGSTLRSWLRHDLVDALDEVLYDALWTHFHLEASRNGMCLDAGNGFPSDTLDLLLLLRCPLSLSC